MNFPSVSLPFGKKEKDSQEKSNEPQKVPGKQAEFDSYMMTAENSPHPKPPQKSDAPSSSFSSNMNKFTLPLGGKTADSKQRPAEIKTSGQQEYEQYEMTAENSPYKPPPASTSTKFSSAIGSTLSKFSQKSSHPKVDLHVDATPASTTSTTVKSKAEEEYEQFAMTAENSPDKKIVQPKPKVTVASRMKSISDFTSNIGKNISDILDLPEPTTNTGKSSNGGTNSGISNANKDGKAGAAEPDIFSSSVLDVVRSLGNDLKQGAKQMLPTKSTTATTTTTTAAAATSSSSSGDRSASAGRRQKPPPPKDNTRIFDYLEMSRDDEEYDTSSYQPSRLAPRGTASPPLKPSKDSKSSALFTPVKGTTATAVTPSAVAASQPTPSSEVSSSSSVTTGSSASSSAVSVSVSASAASLTPLSCAGPADSSFDYLAHNISLNTDLTPIRSPGIAISSNDGEDRMESLLRSIYEAEQQPSPSTRNKNNVDDSDDLAGERLRTSSSEDVAVTKQQLAQLPVNSLLDSEDAAEYDDDYCV